MTMKPFTLFLMLCLIVLLALAVPSVVVQAQEAEVTPEIIQALTDTGADIIVIPAPDTGGSEDGFSVWELIAVIGVVFTGAAFTLVGLLVVSEKLRNNTAQMTTLERAFNSIPQEAMQKIYEISQVVADVGKLAVSMAETLKEATDGIPIKGKPPFTFALTDSNGNTQVVYYEAGTPLLGGPGRFQQHEDGTLTWHPETIPGERG